MAQRRRWGPKLRAEAVGGLACTEPPWHTCGCGRVPRPRSSPPVARAPGTRWRTPQECAPAPSARPPAGEPQPESPPPEARVHRSRWRTPRSRAPADQVPGARQRMPPAFPPSPPRAPRWDAPGSCRRPTALRSRRRRPSGPRTSSCRGPGLAPGPHAAATLWASSAPPQKQAQALLVPPPLPALPQLPVLHELRQTSQHQVSGRKRRLLLLPLLHHGPPPEAQNPPPAQPPGSQGWTLRPAGC
mmetsp:Transcript_105411/g.325145  ORF Transcript_105411/g.325145 Transcript_105411/m.325145 type:complete len:244 (-) Transcript_105411:277-1008(-)